MSDKPKFDPNAPFEPAGGKPKFDPNAAFQAAPLPKDEPPKVLEEMHPNISVLERMAAQNLSTGPDEAAQYLQSKHPELEVKNLDGRVVARGKGEKDYKVLDPGIVSNPSKNPLNPLESFEKEGLMDLGDIGVDALKGAGSVAAGAAGGIGGFALGGPAGMIPGAMGAAGAASGGMETLRQGLGKMLGVNREFAPGQIATETGLGALAPLTFGTGSTGAQLAEAAAKQGLEGKAAESFISSGLRAAEGLGSKAVRAVGNNVLAPLGELLSGVDKDVIKSGAKNIQQINNASKDGIAETVLSAKDNAAKIVTGKRKEAGQAVEKLVGSADGKVDLSQAEAALKSHIAELEGQYQDSGSQFIKEQADALKTTLGKLQNSIPKDAKEAPGILNPLTGQFEAGAAEPMKEGSRLVKPKTAWNIMKTLDDMGEAANTKEFGSRFAAGTSVADKQAANTALGVANDIRSQLDNLTGGQFAKANENFGNVAKDENFLKAFFNDETGQRGYSKLSSVFSDANEPTLARLKAIDQDYGTGLVPTADFVSAYKTYNKPSWFAANARGGATSTTRTNAVHNAIEVIPNRMVRKLANLANLGLAGPKAQKQMFQYYDLLQNQGGLGARAAGLAGSSLGAHSAWNMLNPNGDEQ